MSNIENDMKIKYVFGFAQECKKHNLFIFIDILILNVNIFYLKKEILCKFKGFLDSPYYRRIC